MGPKTFFCSGPYGVKTFSRIGLNGLKTFISVGPYGTENIFLFRSIWTENFSYDFNVKVFTPYGPIEKKVFSPFFSTGTEKRFWSHLDPLYIFNVKPSIITVTDILMITA